MKTAKYLSDLGFKTSGVGIFILADCIDEKRKDISLGLKDIYAKLYEKYNKNYTQIERCIRHSIKNSPYVGKTVAETINDLVIRIEE